MPTDPSAESQYVLALDTNVLMVREPFYRSSSLALAATARDSVRGLMVATTCTTLAYYVERGYGLA